MALSKSITLISGIIIKNSYIRIDSISGSKDNK